MDMYRRVFETSKVLDGETMKKGLEILDTLDGIYSERIDTYSLPEGIKSREQYDEALRQAEYYQKYKDMSDTERLSEEAELKKYTSEYQMPGVNEEYDWLKGQNEYKRIMGLDTAAAEKKIGELEEYADGLRFKSSNKYSTRIRELEEFIETYSGAAGRTDEISAAMNELDSLIEEKDIIDGKFGGDISEFIGKARNELKNAKDTQSLSKYEQLRENTDFAEKSKYNTNGANGMYFLINSKKYARYDENGKKRYVASLGDDDIDVVEYKESYYDLLTDDEIEIYNYLYSVSGEDEAGRYLDALQYTLNLREAHNIRLESDTTAERLLLGAESGIDQFTGGIRSLVDEDYALTPSATQIASSALRPDMGKVEGFFYDVINTTAHQLPSIITSIGLSFINPTVGAAAGTALMGVSSAGNGYAEMRRLGYTKEQSAVYGLLTGISEAALEKVLGGVSKLGGFSSKAITNMVNGLNSAAGKFAVNIGLSALSEAGEEGLQTILEQTIIRNLALGEEKGWSDIEWSDVLYSSLLGGLSGGLMEGASNVGPNAVRYAKGTVKENKNTRNLYGDVQKELVAEGLQSKPGSPAYSLAAKYQKILDNGKDLTGAQLKRLINANDTAIAGESGDAGRQYSISYDSNNTPFVTIEEDILAGVPESEWRRTVKQNLKEKFPNGVTVGNSHIQFTGKSRGEIVGSGYSDMISKASPEEYADKLRSTDNADEILKATTDYVNEAPLHPRRDDIESFGRGKVQIRVGNSDYTADVLVGNKKDGGMILYDIINLESTNISEKKKAAGGNTARLTGGGYDGPDTAAFDGDIPDGRYRSTDYNGSIVSDNSISQTVGSVNTPYYSDSVLGVGMSMIGDSSSKKI